MEHKKAIFLDKDGTLIPDIPYNADPDKITLSEHAVDGLLKLQNNGYLLFVITNQAGIAHGYFHHKELWRIKKKIALLFDFHGLSLAGFYYCPHHPHAKLEAYKKECGCRKPKPGMIMDAADDNGLDLSASWMIGDILDDIEAGNRAGCKSILINNGNETIWKMNDIRTPDYIAVHLNNAAAYILDITSKHRQNELERV